MGKTVVSFSPLISRISGKTRYPADESNPNTKYWLPWNRIWPWCRCGSWYRFRQRRSDPKVINIVKTFPINKNCGKHSISQQQNVSSQIILNYLNHLSIWSVIILREANSKSSIYLKGCPSAVAGEGVVSLHALAPVLAGVLGALALAPLAQAVRELCILPGQ